MQISAMAHTSLRIFNWPNLSRLERFFYEVEHLAIDKHTVAYLSTINKSPTQMDTIQEVLCQVKEKAEALNLKESDLVLDHTIYCKAVEIVMSKKTLTLDHLSS